MFKNCIKHSAKCLMSFQKFNKNFAVRPVPISLFPHYETPLIYNNRKLRKRKIEFIKIFSQN